MTDAATMDVTIQKIPQLARSGKIEIYEDLCLACRECEVACSLYHEDECNPSLSRIHISFDDFTPGAPSIAVCQQCDWPACYYACASRWDEPAIVIDEASGARVIDIERCHGCGACLRACALTPIQAVISPKKLERKRVYLKCDLCHDRPEGPVCVEICPGNALRFVPAEERRP